MICLFFIFVFKQNPLKGGGRQIRKRESLHKVEAAAE